MADEHFTAGDANFRVVGQWCDLVVDDLDEFVGSGDSADLLEFSHAMLARTHGVFFVVDGDLDAEGVTLDEGVSVWLILGDKVVDGDPDADGVPLDE